MKIVLIILGVIAGIIALFLMAALFIKKDYVVVREIIINKPKQEVFDYIKYIKNQDQYSVWVMQDPGMKKTYSGTDGTVGFIYAWDSNKDAGKGEQEIKSLVEGESQEVEIRFSEPFDAVAKGIMTTEAVSDAQTKVKWSFASTMKYPMNFMTLFTEKMMGGDMDKSLTNLKNQLEK